MRPIRLEVTSSAASTVSAAAAQEVTAAGNLVLNGSAVEDGIVIFPSASPVVIHSDGDDSGIDIVVSGTNEMGRSFAETVTGASIGNATTAGFFLTVDAISLDGAAADTISAGNAEGGISIPVPMDVYSNPFQVGLGMICESGMTVSVEHTFDDVYAVGFDAQAAVWFPHATINDATVSADGNYDKAVNAIRLVVDGGDGVAKLNINQSGPL